MSDTRILALVPARGGSKGIPKKNIKVLGGIPLIGYTVAYVKKIFDAADICVSTDDAEIIKTVKEFGIQVPFTRPAELAGDHSGTYEVVMHALNYYKEKGIEYDILALFQPTSPFRKLQHYREALQVFTDDTDMVVSVVKAKANPYYVLMEENEEGLLVKSKTGDFVTRQSLPEVFEINGSIYLYRVSALKNAKSLHLNRMKKYLMEDIYSVDIDNTIDWNYAEFLLEKKLIAFDS